MICFLQYKLCKVKRVSTGPKNVPFLVTHDGRTIRYPDPLIKVNDSVQLDIATSKIMDFIKFESGMLLPDNMLDNLTALCNLFTYTNGIIHVCRQSVHDHWR